MPMQGEFKTWELKIVNSKHMTSTQKAFGHLFFWAGFYDERKTILFFLEKLGVSPFLKLF